MAKVMLVEDDNNLREIYEARLQAEGYAIVSARDGEEALVVAKSEQPDLIISDVMMPKISGFEMLDILRNTEGLKDVKVIMLTALGQSDDQQRADRLGANRYLVKSQVTLEDIVRVAQELLNPQAAASEPAPAAATPPAAEPAAVAVSEPTPEMPVATAPAEPVAAAPAEPAAPAAQTAADENAAMQAQIDNFVATAPAAAPAAEPSATTIASDAATANDDQVMANAVNNLIADTQEAPTETDAAPAAPAVTAEPAPLAAAPVEATPPADTQEAPTETPVPAGSHKKVITPISDPSAQPDINQLLAQEEAKEADTQPVPPAAPGTSLTPGASAPTPPAAPSDGIDPNSIAL